jgi:hypothetical protein
MQKVGLMILQSRGRQHSDSGGDLDGMNGETGGGPESGLQGRAASSGRSLEVGKPFTCLGGSLSNSKPKGKPNQSASVLT